MTEKFEEQWIVGNVKELKEEGGTSVYSEDRHDGLREFHEEQRDGLRQIREERRDGFCKNS